MFDSVLEVMFRSYHHATVFSLAFIFASSFIYCLITLVGPIVFPPIIRHPWPKSSVRDRQRTAVLAGSFDPPHKGHLGMLLYLSERYQRVIVVVGKNPNKRYVLSEERRADLLRQMLRTYTAMKNTHIQVSSGYIWRTVKRQGANVFVRGIRTWEKDGPDERRLQILNTWGPIVFGPMWWPIPTVFLEGIPAYNHVSSTLIREKCRTCSTLLEREEQLATLVPGSIVADVARFYGEAQ